MPMAVRVEDLISMLPQYSSGRGMGSVNRADHSDSVSPGAGL